MKQILIRCIALIALMGSGSVWAVDQCNSTAQCKNIFGSRATDCLDSRSNTSVCMCGSSRCDAASTPAPTPTPTRPPTPVPTPPPSNPGADQCNTTAQCQAIYGNRATDCKDSRSPNSVCMCGSVRCDGGTGNPSPTATPPPPPPSGGKLGRFDKAKDILLVFHDNKPDDDDVHAQAAIGTMLRDSRLSGIDAFAVQGTIGIQGGTQIDSSSLFNMIYGNNWVNALNGNWNGALDATATRAYAALDRGGDLWIVEAGQSDFSADLVRRIKRDRRSVDTKDRVHIVQHSGWNQDKTTPSDLSYVRSNTDYTKIGDGNTGNGSSPDLNPGRGVKAHWDKAFSMPDPVDNYWREAKRITDRTQHNPTIKKGGMDFSDTVEALWIFGLDDDVKRASDDVLGFFNEFD